MPSALTTAMAAMLATAGTAVPPATTSAPRTLDYLLTATSVDQVLTGDVGGVWVDGTDPSSHDVALVLGPSGISTPTDSYLQAAYNLYLEPSGLYTGSESDVYALTTPEPMGDTAVGLAGDEAVLQQELLPLLESGHHVTLFGYSQSTAAISEVLNQLTADYGDKYADDVNFVFVGDSASPDGMLANIFDSLPSWAQSILLDNAEAWALTGAVMNLGPTEPPASDITPDGPYHGDVFTLMSGGSDNPNPDGFAWWSPDSFASGSSLWSQELAGVSSTHLEYLGMTPDDVAQALSQADPSQLVNYLDLNPVQTEIELLTQAAADVGWIPQSFADALLQWGL